MDKHPDVQDIPMPRGSHPVRELQGEPLHGPLPSVQVKTYRLFHIVNVQSVVYGRIYVSNYTLVYMVDNMHGLLIEVN